MKLTLRFTSPDEKVVAQLQEGIGAHPRITVTKLDSRQLSHLPEIDAVFMTIMAAEQWGARPITHEAQVLGTRGEPGWPPYVVAGVAMKKEDPRQPAFELRLIIRAVLKAVMQFNISHSEKIQTVGLSPEWLGLEKLDPKKAGRIIRDAYEDIMNSTTN